MDLTCPECGAELPQHAGECPACKASLPEPGVSEPGISEPVDMIGSGRRVVGSQFAVVGVCGRVSVRPWARLGVGGGCVVAFGEPVGLGVVTE